MKRTLTVVGIVVVALVGALAASQAQSPQNPQAAGEHRGGSPEFGCGPEQGAPPAQGAMRGRGPGGGRQGGLGRPGGPGGPGRGRGGPLCGLDLTEEQKTQIAAIHEKTREQIEAVLTPEQLAKLRGRRGGR